LFLRNRKTRKKAPAWMPTGIKVERKPETEELVPVVEEDDMSAEGGARLGGRAAEVSLWSTGGGEGEEEEEDSIRGARLGRRGRTLAMAMEKRNGREREEEE
jgi:hypothetical protein